MRRVAALAMAAAVAGCGEAERDAPPPQPPPAPAPTVEEYSGPLPGTPFDLDVQAGYLGIARDTVRQVLVADRVRLLVGLDRRDRSLCVGYRQQAGPGFVNADFRCFGPGVALPVIAFVARSGVDVDRVNRVTVLGVARAPVRRAQLVFPDGRRKPVALRALAGVGFRAFAATVRGAPLPRALRAGPHELPLAAIAEPPCAAGAAACVGAAGPWVDVVDAGG